MDQRDSAQADVQRLTEKLRSCAEDLERAQASQEQLLREKSKHQQTLDEAVAKVYLRSQHSKAPVFMAEK